MSRPLLHNLFANWNKTPGLQKIGAGDYLLLQKLIEEKVWPLETFDDAVFVFQTLWLKRQDQLETFRQFFEDRRAAMHDVIKLLSETSPQKNETAAKDKALREEVNKDAGIKRDGKNKETKTGDVSKEAANTTSTTENKTDRDDAQLEGRITLALGNGSAAEVQGGAAYAVPDNQALLPPTKKYLMGTEYFPVQNRVLQQSWRSLYSNREAATIPEINLPKTINKICREGLFTRFEHEAGRENILSLFIFIDQGGSMIACEEFGKELVRTAVQSGVHDPKAEPYFFYNVPQPHDSEGYMLYNEQQTKAFTTNSLFKGLHKKNIVLLIYSDAGAIKGSNSKERVQATTAFLQYVVEHTAYAAWLNPVPEFRWKNTAAESMVAEGMPMFEADRSGIAKAVEFLKGKIGNVKGRREMVAINTQAETFRFVNR